MADGKLGRSGGKIQIVKADAVTSRSRCFAQYLDHLYVSKRDVNRRTASSERATSASSVGYPRARGPVDSSTAAEGTCRSSARRRQQRTEKWRRNPVGRSLNSPAFSEAVGDRLFRFGGR